MTEELMAQLISEQKQTNALLRKLASAGGGEELGFRERPERKLPIYVRYVANPGQQEPYFWYRLAKVPGSDNLTESFIEKPAIRVRLQDMTIKEQHSEEYGYSLKLELHVLSPAPDRIVMGGFHTASSRLLLLALHEATDEQLAGDLTISLEPGTKKGSVKTRLFDANDEEIMTPSVGEDEDPKAWWRQQDWGFYFEQVFIRVRQINGLEVPDLSSEAKAMLVQEASQYFGAIGVNTSEARIKHLQDVYKKPGTADMTVLEMICLVNNLKYRYEKLSRSR